MNEVRSHGVQCPYCGEPLQIEVDTSIADQNYIEDCEVCCRPIELHAIVDADDDIRVEARRDDE